MNVKELIEILQKEVKEVDRENSNIEFFSKEEGEEQGYEIKVMSGFSLSSDIIIELKKIDHPVMTPMVFKEEHTEMVKETTEKIIKEEGKIIPFTGHICLHSSGDYHVEGFPTGFCSMRNPSTTLSANITCENKEYFDQFVERLNVRLEK